MTRIHRTILFIAISALFSVDARAALTNTTWTFEAATDTSNPYDAATLGSGISTASLNVVVPTGGTSTIITSGGFSVGGYLQDGGGTFSNPTTDSSKVTGTTFTFTLTTTAGNLALSSLTYNYEQAGGNNADLATGISWTYSITGGTSGSLSSLAFSTVTGVWQTNSLSLSSIALSTTGNQQVVITGTLTGPANNGHNEGIGFDNFTIAPGGFSQVPEPVNMALAAFGIGIVGLGAGRRIYKKSQA